MGLHLVWCPKYRRRILGGRVAARCGELLEQIASERGWQIVAKEVMPDHMHLSVGVGPRVRRRPWWVHSVDAAHACGAGSLRAYVRSRRFVVALVFRRLGRMSSESTVRRYIEHQYVH